MYYALQDVLPKRPQVLCSHDLVQLARGAALLPGGWTVDPVADIRQAGTPRVWVHSTTENPIGVSLGFAKRGDAFYVLLRYHDEPDSIWREEVRYNDLSTALSMLEILLMMLHQRPLGRSGDETIQSPNSEVKPRWFSVLGMLQR